MAVADLLVEVTRKDLEILKKLYALNANAQNYVTYTALENYIRWFEKDSYLKHVRVYCLNGSFSDGTFVIIVSRIFWLSFFYFHFRKFAQQFRFSSGSRLCVCWHPFTFVQKPHTIARIDRLQPRISFLWPSLWTSSSRPWCTTQSKCWNWVQLVIITLLFAKKWSPEIWCAVSAFSMKLNRMI